ncbi:uncharacterized protein LOC131207976 [Anopheles bellator]|uniref:uncharacterized protein LOC131207976 n=1 Tax=Anopheles bellator TaxID=139047 RepID=UPI00264978AE|nr:uncharacterized protein LOC131207976 [Anopheles bellator]
MFRKTKQTTAPLPKPPTEEQMLEDLQLYHETKPPTSATATGRPAEGSDQSGEANINDWWKLFEATLEDHLEFQHIKHSLEEMCKKLQHTESELQAACDGIQHQLEHDLERLRTTMNG